MNISLLQRIFFFTLGCCFLFILLLGSVIWSSQAIELAFSRNNYAQQLTNQTNTLKQLVAHDDIYSNNYSINDWRSLEVKLTALLKSSPQLTEQQQTIQEFFTEKTRIRKQLREVQHSLNKDIEVLGSWLKLMNIALIPLLLLIFALLRQNRFLRKYTEKRNRKNHT